MTDLPQSLWIDGSLILIAILAAVGLGIALERLAVLAARSGGNRRDFLEGVLSMSREGRIDDAIKACAERPAAVSDVGLVILRSRSRDERELESLARAASLLVTPRLARRLALVRSIGVLAVLVGLTGALGALSDALGNAALEAGRARAIGRALGPLIAGLVVAIPMTALHAALANRAAVVAQRVEEFGVRLVHALSDRPDVRLGHR
jgi:biopolymer transport protein ExbB/TolQ